MGYDSFKWSMLSGTGEAPQGTDILQQRKLFWPEETPQVDEVAYAINARDATGLARCHGRSMPGDRSILRGGSRKTRAPAAAGAAESSRLRSSSHACYLWITLRVIHRSAWRPVAGRVRHSAR